MKFIENNVVPNVALASNLDYAKPLDRSEELGARVSRLSYIKPENPPTESGIFQGTNGAVFQKIAGSKDFGGVAPSGDEPLMQ